MEKIINKQSSIDVGIFKLVTGEEIVAEFSNVTADWIRVKAPRSVVIGQSGLILIPWILTEQNDEYKIDRINIVAMKIENVDARLVQLYLKNVTGIDVQTAAANLVTP